MSGVSSGSSVWIVVVTICLIHAVAVHSTNIACYSCASQFMVLHWYKFFARNPDVEIPAGDDDCKRDRHLSSSKEQSYEMCATGCFTINVTGINAVTQNRVVVGVARGCLDTHTPTYSFDLDHLSSECSASDLQLNTRPKVTLRTEFCPCVQSHCNGPALDLGGRRKTVTLYFPVNGGSSQSRDDRYGEKSDSTKALTRRTKSSASAASRTCCPMLFATTVLLLLLLMAR